tara:strand:- start:3314 stop:3541 length:228 start_codon:yes stop_codon:yes gene_type:complete
MKVKKILHTYIPPYHYKWAGVKEEEEEEKKNDLDVEKLDKLVRKAYHKKYGTYDQKGEFIAHEETEVQDRNSSEE